MPLDCARLIFSGHALRRMFERSVTAADVREALAGSEVIEEYPDDRPLPSFLVLGWVAQRPLHLVVATERSTRTCHIVTVYAPDPRMWSGGYRKRRPK